jgi:DNA-binding CsgD family transcriptional regulator
MTSATAAVLPVMPPPTLTSRPSRGAGRAQRFGLGGHAHPRSQPSSAGTPADRDRPRVELRRALAALLAGCDISRRVRDQIGASWKRSIASGLTPDHVEVPFDPDVDSDGLFARAARPVLDQLALDLAGAPVGVALANALGQVLDLRVSDARLTARLDRIRFAPGFVYAEDLVGTNGIGTALAERRPAAVEGDEHFADALTSVACAAAPISDPRCGRVVGAIGLISLAADSSALMLPLAIRAAREVEQRLVDAAGVSERLVLRRFLQERRRAKGPLVFVTERTMITNAAAERLIDADDEPLLRGYAARLLSGEDGDSSRVVLGGGTAVTVRTEPLFDGGSRVGMILRLKPIADSGAVRPQGRAHRPSFGWDSLTDTEQSVIECVAGGLTNREAAERLFLSRHTVGFHLRSIFSKLGVSSRVELTRLAIEHDTDPPPQDLFALAASG